MADFVGAIGPSGVSTAMWSHMKKRSTNKVFCTTCGAWIAKISPTTREIVRSKWWGGTHFRDGTSEYQEAGTDPTDFTHAKAWCRNCKKWWHWRLTPPTE